MAIINIMEDIVGNVVNQVINNEKTAATESIMKDDIVAYVLNRINPRYVTSERGILHGTIEVRHQTQNKTDILFLIYEAIDVISSRRTTSEKNNEKSAKRKTLPHIVGEVLEETTFSTVPDVKLTLFHEDQIVPMIDSNWMNPYITQKATRGYYHFWPTYDENLIGNKKFLKFILKCEHPKFITKEETIEINITEEANIGSSYIAPIILISAKEDVDLEFLYS